MNSAMTANSAEKRLFRAYWQDGSLDLFAGAGALCIGLSWIFKQAVFGAILPALFIPFWAAWRKRFVEPRLGSVTFAEPRRLKMQKGMVLTVVFGTIAFLMGLAAYFGFDVLMEEGLLWIVPGMPAILLGVMAAMTAIMLGLARFFWYGLALFLGGIAVILLGLNPGWGMGFGGFVMTISGLVLFSRFLREFPVARTELE